MGTETKGLGEISVPERESLKFHNKKQGKNERLFNELGEHVEDCLNDNIP